MFDINGIWNSEKKMIRATGLKLNEIEAIYDDFIEGLNNKRNKNNKKNAGRPPKLTDQELFLMLLIFLRQYLTFDFLSIIFDIDPANVHRWIVDSIDVLADVLQKKNFVRLLHLDQTKLQRMSLKGPAKSILMELNNRYAGQKK